MSLRNSPCKCGSGKKYKKCCMPKEHAMQVQKEKFIRTYNAPCPCGSGKRFGKCCLNKKEPLKRETGLKAEV